MSIHPHLRTTGHALKQWLIAQTQDALAVGAIWFVGLTIIHIPLAFVWAVIGAACQFIPNFGPLISVIGQAITCFFLWLANDDWMPFVYVLILYAIIAVTDGLVLQPYLMKRAAKVPIWASILAPIVLGIIIPFWGVLLAPPLLAIIYTFKAQRNTPPPPPTPDIQPQ